MNLSTGEINRLYTRITPFVVGTRWHDVDHVSGDEYVVADIDQERVYVLNVSTGVVTWSWSLQNAYNVSTSGGNWPYDWTHLNDVEVLPDGRFMLSVRNHDQVIFVSRERGLLENWTLGEEDNYDILNEQHNPDYIPADNGGPAVLVADSENNRVVESQRRNGSWDRSWVWSDSRLQWPRDADRLPNGHTLITDSNGDRILEVDERNEIVWVIHLGLPYEAERLGTGDESTGGESAASLGFVSKTEQLRECRHSWPTCDNTSEPSSPVYSGVVGAIDSFVPNILVNAVLHVLPSWIDILQILAVGASGIVAVVWFAVEHRWGTVRLRNPFVWRPD